MRPFASPLHRRGGAAASTLAKALDTTAELGSRLSESQRTLR
jgi:hypothetical protein